MRLHTKQTTSFCLNAVRKGLKMQSLSYAQVAEVMGVSEATIKRILHDDSIRFDRLLTLCNLAKLSMAELMAQAEEKPASHSYFTDAQDAAFANYPQLLAFFSLLAFEKQSPDDIAHTYDLSPSECYLYLRALENIGLIKLLKDDKVQFLFNLPIGFSPTSLVLKRTLIDKVNRSLETFFSEPESEDFALVKPLHLPTNVHIKMLEELSQIVDKYAQMSEVFGHEGDAVIREVLIMNYLDVPEPELALKPVPKM